jgi:Fe2+ or Zn2+ uptake regulation protein
MPEWRRLVGQGLTASLKTIRKLARFALKKGKHFVICPKCSEAIEIEKIIEHLDQHTASQTKPEPKSGGA